MRNFVQMLLVLVTFMPLLGCESREDKYLRLKDERKEWVLELQDLRKKIEQESGGTPGQVTALIMKDPRAEEIRAEMREIDEQLEAMEKT